MTAKEQALMAELERCDKIKSEFKCDEKFALQAICAGWSLEEAKRRHSEPSPIGGILKPILRHLSRAAGKDSGPRRLPCH